ncbi:hypothetical protein S100390_v1c08780 [Spiroplasma sp. NBRC 100390]|uniref:hypothetical protein n=1 Tax=unclassified Spiroplasma TaxID=2637901 RepID=UPI0008928AEF|nr:MULTISPECIES: hypothetical protein [unclassified Spiroplasma]AOX44214.1 hypothetical protein STU14_v1c08780 [Spiroplasma sp. TU-14]APE13684.1 hypothetical protein S100390_v1c08780 [Spiroplasma sp. NBRC 100390]
MLVTVAGIVLLVLAVLLAIAFGFFIYKDWQRSQQTSNVDQKLIKEEHVEENL